MSVSFDPAWLGARIDGVDPSPLVAGMWLGAAGLLLCALWLRGYRTGNRIALAGGMLAVGAALYSHDVVNLPEIASALVIGGSIGLMLARRCGGHRLPWLVVVAYALLGLAGMATGTALLLNPFAFGLVDGPGRVTPAHGTLLAGGIAIGGLAALCALLMLVRQTQDYLALVGSGAGWTAAALGLAMGNSAMVLAGGMAGAAGLRLGWRAWAIRRAALRALPSGSRFP